MSAYASQPTYNLLQAACQSNMLVALAGIQPPFLKHLE
ncbi:hypothetical protein CZ787_03760 [Halomonas citrativorans]|uniref:Uncharacterized protein n=1 Tax=Halomonas citrativorans TaxID=2742612 RepID=A0A1R4HSI6_9GAMM|nr:hypothetical protein CZ787_03760 [Halomonas citrativorans]